jgi:hypothetical protein
MEGENKEVVFYCQKMAEMEGEKRLPLTARKWQKRGKGRGCRGGDVPTAPADPVAPEIPPLLMQRLPKAESRSFSDSSSRILLLLSFIKSVSVSNLAIAVAAACCKHLVALASTRPAR